MNDFTVYPETVLQELAGAEACIWALGRPLSTHEVEVEYPMAAARAITTTLAPQLPDGNRFRFVYLSGKFSERDMDKTLWFLKDSRRLKGETENKLIDLGSKHADRLETYICRPGFVLSKGNYLPNMLISWSSSIRVNELAATMVKIAMEGNKTQT